MTQFEAVYINFYLIMGEQNKDRIKYIAKYCDPKLQWNLTPFIALTTFKLSVQNFHTIVVRNNCV